VVSASDKHINSTTLWLEKQAKLGFPTAARDRQWLSMTAKA